MYSSNHLQMGLHRGIRGREATIGMNNDLSVPIFPLVKLVIGNLSIIQRDLVGNHEARLGLASDNHIPQVSIIGLDVALTSG